MPEMPEVEQVRKTLAPHITGKKITAVEVRLPRLIKYPSADEFAAKLTGRTITEGYETLGPEPLSSGFTPAYLHPLAAGSRRAIKSFILDQTVIAGLGNIYADECLALAGINPMRTAGSLSAEEIDKLCQAVNTVIAQGIKNRGTTFRDYKDGEGKSGENQKYLLVYGRGGKPCKSCGRPLATAKVGGRGTTYCEFCQK